MTTPAEDVPQQEELTVDAVPSVENEGGETLPPVCLPITEFVQTSRMQNGLRHASYVRYRQYCSRRLLRLRRTLKVKQMPGHGKGPAAHKFTRNPISQDHVKDERYLLIPLMECERAWSYAMELRDQLEHDPPYPHRIRNHMIRKLTRAMQCSDHLLKICRARGDNRTAVEAEAYHHQMKGLWFMERKEFRLALTVYPAAKKIYTELIRISKDAELRKVLTQKVADIEVYIKNCQYNQHLSRSADNGESGNGDTPVEDLEEKLSRVVLEEQSKSTDSVDEVQWKGVSIVVPVGKVRNTLASVREAVEAMQREKDVQKALAAYDSLFMAYNDVIDACKDAIRQLQSDTGKSSTKSSARIQAYENLKEFSSYHRITHVIDRNMLFLYGCRTRFHYPDRPCGLYNPSKTITDADWKKYCGVDQASKTQRATKPEEAVKLYDNIIQNLKDLEANKQDAEEGKRIAAQILTNTGFRCYYVALSFGLNDKFSESMALLERTGQYISTALDHHKECSEKAQDDIAALTELSQQLEVEKCLLRARFLAAKREEKGEEREEGGKSVKEGTLDVWEYKEDFDDKVFDFPPNFQLMHCNPVVFDLALDEIIPPSLESKKAPVKKGLFSWW